MGTQRAARAWTLAAIAAACGGCDRGDAPATPPTSGPAGAPIETGLEGFKAPAVAADGEWVQGPAIAPEAAAGKVVVLEFGFASCRWCAAAQPKLATLAKAHAERGLVVVWVNDGRHAERAEVDEVVKERRLTFPVLHDATGETTKAYRVPGKYPWAVVVDRKGHVAYQGDALRPENEKRLENAITAALR
jgi:peroxiredoxin